MCMYACICQHVSCVVQVDVTYQLGMDPFNLALPSFSQWPPIYPEHFALDLQAEALMQDGM